MAQQYQQGDHSGDQDRFRLIEHPGKRDPTEGTKDIEGHDHSDPEGHRHGVVHVGCPEVKAGLPQEIGPARRAGWVHLIERAQPVGVLHLEQTRIATCRTAVPQNARQECARRFHAGKLPPRSPSEGNPGHFSSCCSATIAW